jgi:hypothetical protein
LSPNPSSDRNIDREPNPHEPHESQSLPNDRPVLALNKPDELAVEAEVVRLPVLGKTLLLGLEAVEQPFLAPGLVRRDRSQRHAVQVQVRRVHLGVVPEDDLLQRRAAIVLEAVVGERGVDEVRRDALERVDGGAEAAVTRQHDVVPDGLACFARVFLRFGDLVGRRARAFREEPHLQADLGDAVCVEARLQNFNILCEVAREERPVEHGHAPAEERDLGDRVLDDDALVAGRAEEVVGRVDGDPVVRDVVADPEVRLLLVDGLAVELEAQLHVVVDHHVPDVDVVLGHEARVAHVEALVGEAQREVERDVEGEEPRGGEDDDEPHEEIVDVLDRAGPDALEQKRLEKEGDDASCNKEHFEF